MWWSIYYILSYFLCALYLPIMFYRYLKYGKYRDNFWKRFYFIPPYFGKQKYIWLHGVSLGEVRALAQLVPYLKKMFGLNVLLTTVTPTGYQAGKDGPFDLVYYLPYDIPGAVSRFLKNLSFEFLLVAETELWPVLFYEIKKRGKKIIIINGRISDKSYPRYLKLSFFFRKVLSLVSLILARTQLDKKRFILIGASPYKVKLGGNIKFLDQQKDIKEEVINNLSNCLQSKIVFLAASTHQGEEEMIIGVYQRLRKIFPQLFLVLVPRHPERTPEIVKLIEEKNLSFLKYSFLKNNSTEKDFKGDILIVDEIGLLKTLYSISDLIFVGGSLVPVGGHNILEALIFNKVVFYGPYMENFLDMKEFFTNRGGIMIKNEKELYLKALDYLKYPDKYPLEIEEVLSKNKQMVENSLWLIKKQVD